MTTFGQDCGSLQSTDKSPASDQSQSTRITSADKETRKLPKDALEKNDHSTNLRFASKEIDSVV